MKQRITIFKPVFRGAFGFGPFRCLSIQLLLAIIPISVFPACQGLRGTAGPRSDGSHTTACLEQAQSAWHIMQRKAPGTKSAQETLRKYNQSVYKFVKSLHEREKMALWGREIQFRKGRRWRVIFDAPAGPGSTRTLALSEFAHCWVAANVKLQNFDQVVAHDGIGVPVVLAQDDSQRVAGHFHPPHGEFLPATAVLEFPPEVPGRPAEARLRFYNPLAVSEVKVGQHHERLAENLTAALQPSLTNTTFKKGRHAPVQSASDEKESGLFFLSRYDSAKVPVVFVHGMNANPSVWKNTINALYADSDLRRRYQPVCFTYPTKLPVPVSAARLRELLKRSRERFDPCHHDAGFAHMVLVGHSIGGLLARMQVIDSGNDFWRAFFTATPHEIAAKVDVKTEHLVQKALFFQPIPNVKLVVFICTPHRGCVLAQSSILRAAMRLILFLPVTARHRMEALAKLPKADMNPVLRDFYDWGVEGPENLSTKHPFFHALARHPVPVTFHSIIATQGSADILTSSDGIVPYWSAHLDRADSETLVPYTHGCLEKPETVQAVIKILKQAQ